MSLTFRLLQYSTITYVETVSRINSYAASSTGVGGSCQIVGCCLISSQNEQAEAY
jgi:hypothetical protein